MRSQRGQTAAARARGWAAFFVTYAVAGQVAGQWQLGASLWRWQNCPRALRQGERDGQGFDRGVAYD
eukprot:5207892-Lingulodinium_polyedra.AAC.1